MEWPTADVIGALTPITALLLAFVWAWRAWVRDRNARIADKDQQISDLKDALARSETARDHDRETARLSLETARAAEQALEGFRRAAEKREGTG